MKKTITYDVNNQKVEREIDYIPVRYIIAVFISLLEVVAVIGILLAMCYYVPYFYLAALATEIACVIRIIASDDNPDYKIPWLLVVLIVPVAGFMLYFMFYSRVLQKRFIRRLDELKKHTYKQEDKELLLSIRNINPVAAAQTKMLCNIADEYINEVVKFGHWKDTGLRLEGEAVWELTKLFLVDFGINVRKMPMVRDDLYPVQPNISESGYIIPFGDGPHPLYERRVGKSVIQNMLSGATRYAWMTSPYLIIDNDLCTDLENAALRGVDVKIIVPHIPDKKLIFAMTRSFYHRLMKAGVKIYEYEPGFIHAKSYLVDDEYAMIGTINLDYRSLVHHFENGVWMYQCEAINSLKVDMADTLSKCIEVTPAMLKTNLLQRFICAVVRIFAPML